MQIETIQAIPILRGRLISQSFKRIPAELKKQRPHPKRKTYASLNWSLRGLPCWTAKAYGLRLNSSPTRREEKEEKDKSKIDDNGKKKRKRTRAKLMIMGRQRGKGQE